MNNISENHREYFDRMAIQWDSIPWDLTRLSDIVDQIPLMAGQNVLDMGCGTGVLYPYLKGKIGEAGIIVGMDISIQMLSKASEKFPDGQCKFAQGEGEALPFCSGYFDHVICFAVFPHLRDKIKSLREIHRILKIGGTLTLFHLLGSAELNARHAEIGGTVANDVLPSADETRKIFVITGFKNVSVEDKPDLFFAVGEK